MSSPSISNPTNFSVEYATNASKQAYLFATTNRLQISAVQHLIVGLVSYSNFVPKWYYRRFFFYNDNDGKHLTVSARSYTGDCDVYVSTAPEIPTQDKSMWQATYVGDDVAYIKSSDKNYCKSCVYNIGVYGYSSCYFSILVEKADGEMTEEDYLLINLTFLFIEPVELADGQPAEGYVNVGSYSYFEYYLSVTAQLSIGVIAGIGSPPDADPDIFVSTKPYPNANVHQWSSINWGDETLTIDRAYASMYYIGIYGNMKNISFQITVTASKIS